MMASWCWRQAELLIPMICVLLFTDCARQVWRRYRVRPVRCSVADCVAVPFVSRNWCVRLRRSCSMYDVIAPSVTPAGRTGPTAAADGHFNVASFVCADQRWPWCSACCNINVRILLANDIHLQNDLLRTGPAQGNLPPQTQWCTLPPITDRSLPELV